MGRIDHNIYLFNLIFIHMLGTLPKYILFYYYITIILVLHVKHNFLSSDWRVQPWILYLSQIKENYFLPWPTHHIHIKNIEQHIVLCGISECLIDCIKVNKHYERVIIVHENINQKLWTQGNKGV
ncbi:hypothetical protein ACJX0J_015403, partial [Zea mays]